MEAFLRGKTSPANQHFLLRRGLLDDLALCLLPIDHRSRKSMRASFDLTAKLVKCNLKALQRLETLLNTETKLRNLVLLIDENLMDSNMLLRSLIISHHEFSTLPKYGRESAEAQFADQSRLLSYFKGFENKARILV